ncbi:hypothetical protein BCF33_0371 [Hasllibacter halocynthiae]|uniref:Uncharacterized protein n=2 Tax=Hasllibacter halocynthiae TaxID=595589 RepID=A0A2T0X773_9RHOB|nr:hypothetical protein BCF33_0371 [Hasllibacter halocynthiae]
MLALALGAAAQAAPAQQAAYDPESFLDAMVRYRTLAATCEEVLPGSPMGDSAEVRLFFEALDQVEPAGTDLRLGRLLDRLVRSHGASICQERLTRSALRYGQEAVRYQAGKGEGWPNAPRISAGPWCASVSCAELLF